MDAKIKNSSGALIEAKSRRQRLQCIVYKKLVFTLLAFMLVLSGQNVFAQGVGISEVKITPHASSILELRSTERGFLIPRMTQGERDLINGGNPATGLIIYNTTTNKLNIYDGTDWKVLFSGYIGINDIIGTTDRITIDKTDPANPIIDIASTYGGQTSIDTLGTITTGTWNASTVEVPYGGTGLTSITTNNLLYGNGTNAISLLAPSVTTGAILMNTAAGAPSWSTLDALPATAGILNTVNGGTGQSTYTDGQLLIGNSAGSLTRTTLTGTTNQVIVTNGNGSITLSTPQDIHAGATPEFVSVYLSDLNPNSGVYTDGSSVLTTSIPTTGNLGFWNRTGTTLSPATNGDDITTTGAIYTTGTGTMTSAGLLTAEDGIDVTAGDVNITDNLNVSTNADITGTLNVDGTSTTTGITNTGNITNTADISTATLQTSGTATLNDATVNTTLDVTGATTLASTLDVTGTTTLDGTNGLQFDAGQNVTDIVTTIGTPGQDTNLPTEKAVRDAIAVVQLDADNLQTELDNTQIGAGLDVDGSYVANVGTNYIDAATSLNNANVLIDTELGNVQTEVDNIETGAGLNVDGTYTANATANYISGASDLQNADDLLDAQVKTNADNIALKAAVASPTFTGTVTIPSPFTLGATSVTTTGTELNYVAGVTSAIQTQLDAKQSNTLTDGNILIGDGTNTAVAQTMSGDVTISNTGVTAIQQGAVEATAIEGLSSGQFIIGVDGTAASNAKVTMSGDATLANNGALTIADNAITNVKMADNAIGNAEMADNAIGNAELQDDAVTTTEIADAAADMILTTDASGVPTWDAKANYTATLASGRIFIGNAGGIATARIMSGDATMNNTGVLTISADAIGSSEISNGTILNEDITDGTIDLTAKVTGTLPVANGGTGLSSTTANQILYSSAANTIAELPTSNDGVLVTDGSGAPSISSTLPPVQLTAGTATAGTAPLKFTAGTDLTTPEDGAMEYDGDNLTITDQTNTRYTLAKTLTATATLDFDWTDQWSISDLTITLNGASVGDPVILGVPNSATNAYSIYTAWVSGPNTVTVRYLNNIDAWSNPDSGTFRVTIIKY